MYVFVYFKVLYKLAYNEIIVYIFSTLAFKIRTLSTGRSFLSVSTIPIRFTTCIPVYTLPNIACFPSNHCVGANVMKNCEPFVSGPELAIERIPAPVCFKSGWISSANSPPYIEVPPRPVPVGSPPCRSDQ